MEEEAYEKVEEEAQKDEAEVQVDVSFPTSAAMILLAYPCLLCLVFVDLLVFFFFSSYVWCL